VTEEFLQEDPTTWDTNDAYIQTQAKAARQLNVLNDAAGMVLYSIRRSVKYSLTNSVE